MNFRKNRKDKTMKEKFKRTLTGLLVLLSLCAPITVFGVSYPVQLYHRQDRHDAFVQGDTAYLFHSGTDAVRKTIHPNDVITVYRISPSCEVAEAGKIKVISYVGETYLKAEIIEGEIKPDDIAKKGKVSCIVISAGVCPKY
jgi:hypothetical protein